MPPVTEPGYSNIPHAMGPLGFAWPGGHQGPSQRQQRNSNDAPVNPVDGSDDGGMTPPAAPAEAGGEAAGIEQLALLA